MKLEQIAQTNTHERIWTIDWHPHAQMFATAGESRSVKLWTLTQQYNITLHEEIPTDHTKSIRRLKFSHHGKNFATASFDGTISIFARGQDTYQQLAWLQGHQNEVKAVDWSPNDQKLVSCSRDKNLWVWTYNSTICDYECETVLEGHTEDIKAVIWLENDVLASCSYDTTVRIWAEDDGQMMPFQTLQAHKNTVWNLAFDSKTQKLYTCGDDGGILVWARNPNDQRFNLECAINQIHIMPVYGICLIEDELFATCSGDNSVALVHKKQAAGRLMHEGEVNAVSYRNKLLLSGGDDQKIVVSKIVASKIVGI